MHESKYLSLKLADPNDKPGWLNTNNFNLETIDTAVGELQSGTSSITSLLEERVDDLESLTTTQGERISANTSSIAALSTTLIAFKTVQAAKNESVDGRLSTLESNSLQTGTDISKLKKDMANTTSIVAVAVKKVDDAVEEVDGFATEIDGIRSDFVTIQTNFSQIENDFSDLETEVAGYSGDIATAKSDATIAKTAARDAQEKANDSYKTVKYDYVANGTLTFTPIVSSKPFVISGDVHITPAYLNISGAPPLFYTNTVSSVISFYGDAYETTSSTNSRSVNCVFLPMTDYRGITSNIAGFLIYEKDRTVTISDMNAAVIKFVSSTSTHGNISRNVNLSTSTS